MKSPNTHNSSRLHLTPRTAALGVVAATLVPAGAAHLTGHESKLVSAENTQVLDVGAIIPKPEFVLTLEPEVVSEEYVALEAGNAANGANDGTVTGLAADYANLYGLDKDTEVQIANEIEEKYGVALHPGDVIVARRLGPQDLSANPTDQVREITGLQP